MLTVKELLVAHGWTVSDIDTRRRAACDLVKALSKQFEGPVVQNFSQYVQAMLGVSICYTLRFQRNSSKKTQYKRLVSKMKFS